MSQEVIEGEIVETALAVRPAALPAAPQLLDALRPAERVALLAEISAVVADVIEKQQWFKKIGPRKHILIQGWTFIGGLGGCSAKTTHTEKIDGGFKAHATVVRVDTGIEVGSADQVCMASESNWRGKDDYALIGMASTRACSRALSTVFRHVVELAGYSATPAEEMTGVAGFSDPKPAPAAKAERRSPPREEPPAPPSAPTALESLLTRAVALGAIDGRETAKLAAWATERGLLQDGKMRERWLPAISAALDGVEAANRAAAKAEAAPVTYHPKPAERPHFDSDDRDDGPPDADRITRRLFALLNERGMSDKAIRLEFAAENGFAVASYKELTMEQKVALTRKLEMRPPVKA